MSLKIYKDNQKVIKPEIALLVACAHFPMTEEHVGAVGKLLSKKIDWKFVIKYANYHKIIPLLHKALTTHFNNDVPDSVLKSINTLFIENCYSTLAKSASLVNVINLLNGNGIDVLPVKGPLLTNRLFGTFTMRSYGDLDILIRRVDVPKALKVLQENSYTLIPKGIPESIYLRFLKNKYHGQLLDKKGIIIELHWELTGFYVSKPMTLESLNPFLISSKISNCTTLDLTNEMLFLFLCIHGNRHRLGKLEYLCSIAQLLNVAKDIDWALVLNLGKKYKAINRILVSLCAVTKLFGVPFSYPLNIASLMANNPHIDRLAEKVIEREIYQGLEEGEKNPLQKMITYQLAVMDSRFEAFRYILRSIVVPSHEAWVSLKLPRLLFLMYYLYKTYLTLSVPIINRLRVKLKYFMS